MISLFECLKNYEYIILISTVSIIFIIYYLSEFYLINYLLLFFLFFKNLFTNEAIKNNFFDKFFQYKQS